MKTFGDRLPAYHVADLVPVLLNGTLPSAERGRVMGHIQDCAACAAELRAWQAIQAATRAAPRPAHEAPDATLAQVWAVLDHGRRTTTTPPDLITTPQPQQPLRLEVPMTTYAFPVPPLAPAERIGSDSARRPRLASPAARRWLSLLAVAALVLLAVSAVLLQGQGERTRSALSGLLRWQQEIPPDVPMYRGNPQHTGESPGPGPESKPQILWQMQTRGPIHTTPALVDGVLYVGSLDGQISAVEYATGAERWRFDTGGHPEAHPTVAGGLVFVGDNNPYQTDGTLFVLDADDGTEQWRLPDAQTSAPLVVDGTLYTGTSDGIFHAFDAANGTERWRVETAPLSRGATLANGLLYFGSKDGTIYARDVVDGTERWRYQTDGGQLGTVVVVDGMAYEIAFDGPADQLYALDAATGDERWRFAINARLQPPVVKDGVVYLPGGDGSVYALDAATGTVRWRFDFGDPTVLGPVLVGDTLYIVGGSPVLYAVDTATGKERWHVELDGAIGSSPIVSGGVIYVTTNAGSLYALGERTEDAPVVLPAPSDAERGGSPAEFLWQAANGSEPIHGLTGIAVAPNGAIWTIEGETNRILMFSPEGAFREAWGGPGPGEGEFAFRLESDGGIYGDLGFDPDGNLYVLDSGNYRVQKFDRTRHFVTAWGSQGSGNGQFQAPVTLAVDAQGNIYVGDDGRGDIQQFASDGTYLATIARRGEGQGETECLPDFGVDAAGTLYLPDCHRHQIQVFAADGTYLATWGSEGKGEGQFTFPVAVAIDAEGRVYVSDAGNNRVQVLDAQGTYLTSWGSFGSDEGEFNGTGAIVLDGRGNAYVGDGNGRLQKFRLAPPLGPDLTATPTT
jgi:outer membrane protein assembly factor BamB